MRSIKGIGLMVVVVLAMASVLPWSREGEASTDDGIRGYFDPLPEQAPEPEDNLTTPEKVALGRKLFFDPRLSEDGTVSCNSCHNVMAGGEDGRAVSAGVAGHTGDRSAPTVWNAAFLSAQFWDGRAATLEDQAKGPIMNPVEMAMSGEVEVLERVRRIPGYPRLFEEAFGVEDGQDVVTLDRLAKAIAAYERTLITPNGPFDRYLMGDDEAISDRAKEGARLFREIGCQGCHSGSNFAGPELSVGEPFLQRFPVDENHPYVQEYDLLEDEGRYKVTGSEADRYLFRVPTLRNIELTAPYFHNGSAATLQEAVRVMAATQLGRELDDDEVGRIVAFLRTLTGERPEQRMPQLPTTPGRSVIPN